MLLGSLSAPRHPVAAAGDGVGKGGDRGREGMEGKQERKEKV